MLTTARSQNGAAHRRRNGVKPKSAQLDGVDDFPVRRRDDCVIRSFEFLICQDLSSDNSILLAAAAATSPTATMPHAQWSDRIRQLVSRRSLNGRSAAASLTSVSPKPQPHEAAAAPTRKKSHDADGVVFRATPPSQRKSSTTAAATAAAAAAPIKKKHRSKSTTRAETAASGAASPYLIAEIGEHAAVELPVHVEVARTLLARTQRASLDNDQSAAAANVAPSERRSRKTRRAAVEQRPPLQQEPSAIGVQPLATRLPSSSSSSAATRVPIHLVAETTSTRRQIFRRTRSATASAAQNEAAAAAMTDDDDESPLPPPPLHRSTHFPVDEVAQLGDNSHALYQPSVGEFDEYGGYKPSAIWRDAAAAVDYAKLIPAAATSTASTQTPLAAAAYPTAAAATNESGYQSALSLSIPPLSTASGGGDGGSSSHVTPSATTIIVAHNNAYASSAARSQSQAVTTTPRLFARTLDRSHALATSRSLRARSASSRGTIFARESRLAAAGKHSEAAAFATSATKGGRNGGGGRGRGSDGAAALYHLKSAKSDGNLFRYERAATIDETLETLRDRVQVSERLLSDASSFLL